MSRKPDQVREKGVRLRALALAVFFFHFSHRHQQFKADLGVALVAQGEFFMRLEGGFMRQPVLRVRDLIDPRFRNHFARSVLCLGGIGSHALFQVA